MESFATPVASSPERIDATRKRKRMSQATRKYLQKQQRLADDTKEAVALMEMLEARVVSLQADLDVFIGNDWTTLLDETQPQPAMKRLKTETTTPPDADAFAHGLEELFLAPPLEPPLESRQLRPVEQNETVSDRAFTASATLLALDKCLDSFHARLDATRGRFKRESHELLGHLHSIFVDLNGSSVAAPEHPSALPMRTLQSQAGDGDGEAKAETETKELEGDGTVEADDREAQVRGELDDHLFVDDPELVAFLVDVFDHLGDDMGDMDVDGAVNTDDSVIGGAQVDADAVEAETLTLMASSVVVASAFGNDDETHQHHPQQQQEQQQPKDRSSWTAIAHEMMRSFNLKFKTWMRG
jgi:hypothetical protein